MILNTPRTNRCKAYFTRIILGELSGINCWVAGGAIRTWYANEKASDIDLFFPDAKSRGDAQNRLLTNSAKVIFENEKVAKLRHGKHVIDIVKMNFDSPEKTISEFDFTVTMAAVTESDSFFGNDFFMDLASKRLAVNKLPFPASTMMRLQKYHRRGYFICKEEVSKLIVALQGFDIAEMFNEDGTINITNDSDTGNAFAGID